MMMMMMMCFQAVSCCSRGHWLLHDFRAKNSKSIVTLTLNVYFETWIRRNRKEKNRKNQKIAARLTISLILLLSSHLTNFIPTNKQRTSIPRMNHRSNNNNTDYNNNNNNIMKSQEMEWEPITLPNDDEKVVMPWSQQEKENRINTQTKQ